MMKHGPLALAGLLLGLSATPVFGQHLYKYRMPDGTIQYTDSRSNFTDQYIKGTLEETIPEPPPAPSEADAAMRARSAARVRNASDAAQAAGQGADAAYAMVVQAQQQLDQAQQALQAGFEPLPGERLGIVDGHTRLSDAYWARINGLRRAVDDARDRLDRANRAWVKARG
jgi:hypothetical protein